MQLRLKITHIPGVFALVDADGVIYSKNSVIQTARYDYKNEAEKQAMLEQLRAFAKGVEEGWVLARNALGTPWLDSKVEEMAL